MWQEDDQDTIAESPEVCDLNFRISATTLPHDHALALSRAVLRHLPWLEDELRGGIHLIHYPGETPNEEAGNQIDDFFNVSRRIPLTLRLPRNRVEEASSLCGQTLDIDGHALVVGAAKTRELVASDTLIARRVLHDDSIAEPDFIDSIVRHYASMGISIRKIVCGQAARIQLRDNSPTVRSVMITGLKPRDAIDLQCSHLGEGRLYGCGLFLPHKGLGQPGQDS